jgi:hypothetical protein
MSTKPKTVSSFPNLSTYGMPIGGGAGTVPAWSRPDLVVAAPAGIGSHTPANSIASAGNTTSLAAGQDIQHTAQMNISLVAKDGFVVYAYGKAQNGQSPTKRPVSSCMRPAATSTPKAKADPPRSRRTKPLMSPAPTAWCASPRRTTCC